MPVLNHALVGGDGFFENEYLSLGINAYGSLGSAGAVPAGFAASGFSNVGMYAYGENPALSDATLPGTPNDSFVVAHDGSQYINSARDGHTDIAGVLKDTSTSTQLKDKWTANAGTAAGLSVSQSYAMTSTDHYLTVKVTLKNTTGSTMHNVDFLKSVDPDQSGNVTNNVIFSQLGGSKPVHGVAAYTDTDQGQYGGDAVFLYTKDTHATAAIGPSYVDYNAYDTGLLGQAQGLDINDDRDINLLFQFGTLAPGASVTVTYYEGMSDSLPQEIAKLGSHPSTAGFTDGNDFVINYDATTKINVDALQGNDVVTGGGAADVIQGGAGDDSLYGYAGKDVLMGGAGNDHLTGDSFTQNYNGAPGQDILYGGAGADTFYFVFPGDSSVKHPDQIMDFSHSQGDKIDVSNIDANTSVSGNQAFTFIGTAAFSHNAGELHEVATTGGWNVSGDLNGDAVADFTIFVASHGTPLVAGDFVL